MLEDLHWADQTSLQLVERLLALPERAAVLLLLTQRNEPDHPSWALRERAEREYPHLTLELALQPLSGDAQGELLASLVGPGTLPPELEWRLLDQAEGNPFYLEELIRSLVDSGALVRDDGGWRFDHDVAVSVPPTVEKVILARTRPALTGVSRGGHGRLRARQALRRCRCSRASSTAAAAPWTRCTSCSASISCGRHGAGRSPSTASSTR